jgi:hypothetical protein
MRRFVPAWLLALSIAAIGCRSTVDADELEDGNGEEEGSGIGEIELYTLSNAASDNTKSVTMDIGRVSIHIADEDVIEEFGGEWVDLTQDAGVFTVVEKQPTEYLIARGPAPMAKYDAIEVEIYGGTYINSEGDVFDVQSPESLGPQGLLTINTDFCVNEDETSRIDSQLHASVGAESNTDVWFDLDAEVDDNGSCKAESGDDQ